MYSKPTCLELLTLSSIYHEQRAQSMIAWSQLRKSRYTLAEFGLAPIVVVTSKVVVGYRQRDLFHYSHLHLHPLYNL